MYMSFVVLCRVQMVHTVLLGHQVHLESEYVYYCEYEQNGHAVPTYYPLQGDPGWAGTPGVDGYPGPVVSLVSLSYL